MKDMTPQEKLAALAQRAIPFLRDEGAKYEDDGSNEPLELARDIEQALSEHGGGGEAVPENWRELLDESRANFIGQFGEAHTSAEWVYADLAELFGDAAPLTPTNGGGAVCRVCDGGPGNSGVCLCGLKAYPPTPSAPVVDDGAHVFNCRRCPVSVESRWLEPPCPECGDPTELDANAKPAALSGVSAPVGVEVAEGLCDPVPGAKFGHHPDPAIDFCIEVESLEARMFNARHGIGKPGQPPESVEAVNEAIERALRFRVGGDANAVAAKTALRALTPAATPRGEELTTCRVPHYKHEPCHNCEHPAASEDGLQKVAREILAYAMDEGQCWNHTLQYWIIPRDKLLDWNRRLAASGQGVDAKDAARYRFLRTSPTDGSWGVPRIAVPSGPANGVYVNEEDADAEVDAAMAAAPTQEGK